jgi:hypothetical protein
MAVNTRFIGLDLHAETIAVAEGRGQVRALGQFRIGWRQCDDCSGRCASPVSCEFAAKRGQATSEPVARARKAVLRRLEFHENTRDPVPALRAREDHLRLSAAGS